jgi:peptide chain release factor subunit 3
VQLAKSLGILKLIIVVNKMDESSVKWSKDRYEEIRSKLAPFIENCGFSVERDTIWTVW